MLRSARVFLGAAAAAWLVIAAHAFGVARRPLWRRWDLGAAPPSDNGDLNDLTVSHMKELLRAAGLPVSGLKKDLIGRLIDAFPSFAGGGTAAVAPKKELPKATSARVEISPPLPPPSPDAAAAAAAATGGAGAACVLQFDGGSRGNPGPAGAGSLLMDAATGAVLWEACVYLGPRHTNNVAEYRGVIAGLKQVTAPHALFLICSSSCFHSHVSNVTRPWRWACPHSPSKATRNSCSSSCTARSRSKTRTSRYPPPTCMRACVGLLCGHASMHSLPPVACVVC